jgi:hypothetical protein
MDSLRKLQLQLGAQIGNREKILEIIVPKGRGLGRIWDLGML